MFVIMFARIYLLNLSSVVFFKRYFESKISLQVDGDSIKYRDGSSSNALLFSWA